MVFIYHKLYTKLPAGKSFAYSKEKWTLKDVYSEETSCPTLFLTASNRVHLSAKDPQEELALANLLQGHFYDL